MKERSSYSAGFKLKVIEYAEKHGNQAAGHEFSVTEFNVRYCRKQKLALQTPVSREKHSEDLKVKSLLNWRLSY
jgi:hypothetical protein